MAFSFRRRSRSPERPLHPLIIVGVIIAGGLALFSLIRSLFFGSSGDLEAVYVKVPPQNTVYVQVADNSIFTPVSAESLKMLENEAVQTRNTALSNLSFFDGSKILMDTKTEIRLARSRMQKGEARDILVNLVSGQIWAAVTPSVNPSASFRIQMGDSLFLESKNGHFAVSTAEPMLQVAKGEVKVFLLSENKEVFSQSVGVGQQFSLAGDVTKNTIGIVEDNSWFALHKNTDILSQNPTGDSSAPDTSGDDSSSENPSEESSDTIQITVPGKNGETVKVSSEPQKISGSVSTEVAAVEINDYRLQKFKKGDTSFEYVASVALESLKEGENEYTIKAYDAKDVLLEEVKIFLEYDPDEGSEDEDESETPDSSSEVGDLGLAITAPTSGESYTAPDTKGFEIKGTAPKDAAKIVVNGYALSKFVAGNANWVYRVHPDLENVKAGENTYTVEARDKDGKLIGTDSLIVTFPEEKKEEVTPPVTDETPKEEEKPVEAGKTPETPASPDETPKAGEDQ